MISMAQVLLGSSFYPLSWYFSQFSTSWQQLPMIYDIQITSELSLVVIFQMNICLINLVMILLRTNLARWFHFARPTITALSSLPDLEAALQERVIRSIKQLNAHTLRHHSLVDEIQEKLVLQKTSAEHVSERTMQLTVVNPRTLENRQVEVRLDKGLKSMTVHAQQFGLPFTTASQSLTHFSKKRGIASFQQLSQYQLDQTTLLIFNLPDNITEQDIQVMLKEKPKSIKFKYCVLGLPAYARVQFQDSETLDRCRGKIKRKQIDFGDRTSKVKFSEDQERLRLANRRLVIHIEPDASLPKMVVELSRFGRVMHIDWPIEASMNPTAEDAKQFYKDTTELIRISKYYPDGTVQSEYYPDLQAWRVDEDEREESNLIDRAQKLQEAYENRCRFAKQINVYVGREGQLSLNNRGYCVVTFSTSEQCQNYYFTHSSAAKMDLVGQKLQFEYDPTFRKELLRMIDNEYLLARKNDFEEHQKKAAKQISLIDDSKQVYDQGSYELNDGRGFQSYQIYDKILLKRYFDEGLGMTENFSPFESMFDEQNQFKEWEDRKRQMKDLKASFSSKTFDELAELQLYGRVLPKDGKIQKLKIENTKYKVSKEMQLINENNLLVSSMDVKSRDKMYLRLRERNNRRADEALGIQHNQPYSEEGGAEGQEEEGAEVEREDDGENIGKHHFSTYKPQALYRKRTPEEDANYERRYCQFVRSTIYEYMGVFHDQIIEEAITGQLDHLNPQSLRFSDGSPFLSDSQVTDVLQFRRDLHKAQQDFEDYVYGSEYIKSSGISIKKLQANFKELEGLTLAQLADVGVVEQSIKIKGSESEIKQKIKILNASVAEFGEEYKHQIIEGQHYLVKVRKLQHLLPLDRIAHLEKIAQLFDDDITVEEAQIFDQHYKQMIQTGQIPDRVRQAFGIENQLTLNQLMLQMGVVYDVSQKDLSIVERAKTYSKDEIKEDIKYQQRIEKYRRNKRKIGSYDFAKDPSEIYVRDREGYYKVSRYRQI